MKALIHIDPSSKQVVGVWVSKAGKLTSYYDSEGAGTEYQQQVGTSTMQRKKPEAPWNNWCDSLAARTPVTAWWETQTFDAKMTAKEIFDSVSA